MVQFPKSSQLSQEYLRVVFWAQYSTSDIHTTAETTIGTFADDTMILSSHEHPETASKQLHHHLNLLDQWAKNGKLK
jgi:hypothetical protein